MRRLRYIATVAVILLAHTSLSARNRLHTIDDMNRTAHVVNSHAGAESRSSLEMDFSSKRLITNEELEVRGGAVYSRIKKMANGEWLMLFQGYHIGSYIYYSISKDLQKWDYRKVLFRPYAVTTSLGDDQRRFSTADAVVLSNGDILVVCSYRAHKGYRHSVDCGIMMRRSKDNGKTWSDEQIIYEGANWEPYLLQLPDGRVQCYFTDSVPAIKNSGTSVVVSCDNGATWSEKMVVCRQYRHTYEDGTRIYTDQMPSFRLLNDGTTLLGFMESNCAAPTEKGDYRMSVVRQHGVDWRPLKGDEVAPADRDTNVMKGAGGYVSNFPSGETVLSCNINNRFVLKVGNHTGTKFNGDAWDKDWMRLFAGYWGSTEVMESHRLLATVHNKKGVQYGVCHLNHDITAVENRVKIDAKGDEWQHDEALFVGSETPSQVIVRASRDKASLYLLVECKSEDVDAEVSLGIGALPKFAVWCGGYDKSVTKAYGIKAKSRKATTAKGERGFVAEVSIPLSALKGATSVPLRVTLSAEEKRDTFHAGAVPHIKL